MSKTPEKLAVEFSKFDSATDIGTDLDSYRQGLFEGFLAGYRAAQDQFRSATGEAGDKLTPTDWISAGYKAAQDQLADISKVMNSPEKLDSSNFSNNSNGWISVKDRLPEINKGFIGFAENKEVCNCYRYPDHSKDGRPVFYAQTKTGLLICGLESISHWQPLPAPPEEEK